jgi:spermidine synthase
MVQMGIATQTKTLYKTTSPFNEIEVTQKGNILTLWSPGTIKQSEMNEQHPLRPQLEYHCHLLLSLVFNLRPAAILAFGLGAGIVPRILHSICDGADVEVVEIDPEILAVAKRYFGFKLCDALQVHLEDAFEFQEKAYKHYDIIILDTYCGNDLPISVDSSFFMNGCARLLSPHGVMVANLMTRDKVMLKIRLQWMKQAFGKLMILPGKKSGNMVVFAGYKLPKRETLKQNAHIVDNLFPYRFRAQWMVNRLKEEPDI